MSSPSASFFQPLYSLAHRRTVGLEAFASAEHNHPHIPQDDAEREQRHTSDLTVQLRHAQRFIELNQPGLWLSLNIDPATIHHPKRTEALVNTLAMSGIEPGSIILEILEHALPANSATNDSVRLLREAGYLIAIDNFGETHTNIERIYDLQPDLVKFSQHLIRRASAQPRARALLTRLVHLMHEAGALVVEEGVETESDVRTALETGCDLVQGYFVAAPALHPEADANITPRIDARWDELMGREMLKRKVNRRHLELARQAFVQAAIALMQGTPFSSAATPMLALPDVLRCFLLDHEGRQLGRNLNTRHSKNQTTTRFSPLADTTGAIWSRRAYFQHAIEQPGVLYMSQPYLSMTDTRTCVTLSMAIEIDEAMHVLCADLAVPGNT